MKNIHLLPTDKPNKLILNYIKGKCSKDVLAVNNINATWYILKYQNIYITSDEEIKEGDWWLNLKTNDVDKCTHKSEVLLYNSEKYEYIKKIILTTDQDLINDGVQEINDEFLEWFVKNPSCEEVEFKKESEFYRSGPLDLLGYNIVTYKITIPEKITRCCGRCNGVDDLCYSDMTCDNHKERGCEICYGKRIEYQINIPKEEPKQEIVGYRLKPHIDRMVVDAILKNAMPIWNGEDKSVYFIRGHVAGSLVAKMKELQVLDLWFTPIYESEEVKSDWVKEHHLDFYYKEGIMKDDLKQETLEEVAERLYRFEADPNFPDEQEHEEFIRIFKRGAKWQQEQNKNLYSEEDMIDYAKHTSKYNIIEPKEWFEQFKKK